MHGHIPALLLRILEHRKFRHPKEPEVVLFQKAELPGTFAAQRSERGEYRFVIGVGYDQDEVARPGSDTAENGGFFLVRI
jgi:hypothetical protein